MRPAGCLRDTTAPGTFGATLLWWRQHRGLSQLDFATAAETTQGRMGFLESDLAAGSSPA